MAKNKFGIQFDGFEALAKKFTELGGNLKELSEESLKESHKFVTPNLHKAMTKHNDTGKTEKSIVDSPKIEWTGTVGSIEIGFDIDNGGLPSVFLMYGTPKHPPIGKNGGHPGTSADKKLYNAIYSTKTRKNLTELQKEIFTKAIQKKMGE